MTNWMSQIFAGSSTSDLWAALVLLGILIAIVALLSEILKRPIVKLTHSTLVVLKDSTDSLGRPSRRLTNLMILYKLRSMKSDTLNEAAFRKAQAATDNAETGSFEVRFIGEALGLWVATAFNSIDDRAKRNTLLEDVARLFRMPGGQGIPAGNAAGPPQKKPAPPPPAQTGPPLQTSNED